MFYNVPITCGIRITKQMLFGEHSPRKTLRAAISLCPHAPSGQENQNTVLLGFPSKSPPPRLEDPSLCNHSGILFACHLHTIDSKPFMCNIFTYGSSLFPLISFQVGMKVAHVRMGRSPGNSLTAISTPSIHPMPQTNASSWG